MLCAGDEKDLPGEVGDKGGLWSKAPDSVPVWVESGDRGVPDNDEVGEWSGSLKKSGLDGEKRSINESRPGFADD